MNQVLVKHSKALDCALIDMESDDVNSSILELIELQPEEALVEMGVQLD